MAAQKFGTLGLQYPKVQTLGRVGILRVLQRLNVTYDF